MNTKKLVIVPENISKVIALLRFPLIVMVVIIHCNMGGFRTEIFNSCLQNIILLAVPFFFVISGYNFSKSNKSYFIKIKDRIQTLLIPYLIWNFIAYIVSMRYKGLYLPNWEIIVPNPINFPLWYLRDLFILCLLYPLISLLTNRLKGILFLIVTLPLCYNNYIFPVIGLRHYAIFFFGIGILMFRYLRAKNFSIIVSYYFEFFIYLITIILFIASLFIRETMNPKSLWFVFYMLFAIISLLFILLRTENRLHYTFLFNLGKKSFFIYCIHCVLISGFAVFLVNLTPLYSEIKIFLASGLSISLCLLVFYLMKRYTPNILKILNGGKI